MKTELVTFHLAPKANSKAFFISHSLQGPEFIILKRHFSNIPLCLKHQNQVSYIGNLGFIIDNLQG